MSSRGKTAVAVLAGVIVLLLAGRSARAIDEEGCLFCHGLDMRLPAPEAEGRDLRVRELLGGVHVALFCSDCHQDARRAPHAAEPGPAQCIGECHGQTATAKDSHRRASYGGLSEPHRHVSSPDAPCRLCHRGTDKAATPGAILERCAGCHPGERDSEVRGVHARLAGRRGVGLCAGCHVPHPATPGGRNAGCDGASCHKTVTAGMRRLVGHKEAGGVGGRASDAGVLVGIAALGLIAGRRLSPRRRKGGDAG